MFSQILKVAADVEMRLQHVDALERMLVMPSLF